MLADGSKQRVHLDKITSRVEHLSYGLDLDYVVPVCPFHSFLSRILFDLQVKITMHVVNNIYDGITTVELDEFAANYASTLAAEHPDFATLAGRIAVSNLQKQTSKLFSTAMRKLHENVNANTGKPQPLIADDVYEIVEKNKEVRLDSNLIYFFLFSG